MDEIIKFLKNNYIEILSILAFIISLIDLLYLIVTNKKRLKFNMVNYTIGDVNNKKFYILNIELQNKSRLPISINEISFKYNKVTYRVIKSPRLLAEKNVTRNKELIKHQEIHSVKFPINISGLCSEQKFIVMYGPEIINNKKCIITINTNRGKIKKILNLNKYYLDFKTFKDKNSEFYD